MEYKPGALVRARDRDWVVLPSHDKNLLERREIKRFAVIALPHLCEQWQAELKDKFGIDAVIIRTNTQARLDRQIPGDTGTNTNTETKTETYDVGGIHESPKGSDSNDDTYG